MQPQLRMEPVYNIMFLLTGMFWLAFVIEATVRIRACPEHTGGRGECSCSAMDRSVSCKRLYGLSHRLPVGIPIQTKNLSVTYSLVTKLGPNAFYGCTKLETVDLSHNKIKDISPSAFEVPKHMKKLSLAFNHLRFLPGDTFMHLSMLNHLDLSGNKLIVLVPVNFAKLSSLKELILRNNPTMCIAPNAFANLTSMEVLEMSHIKSGIYNELLYDSTNLKRLVIKHAEAVDSIPSAFFRNNKKIQEVHLGYLPSLNNHGLPDEILTDLKELETLTIKSCNFTSVPSRTLERVASNLRHLDLSHNPINSLQKDDLRFLEVLETLNIRSTGLAYVSDWALAIPTLSILDLSNNKLTGLKRDVFGNCKLYLKLAILGNNPWICDCDLKWVVEAEFNHSCEAQVVCEKPPAMHGKDIRHLNTSTLPDDYFLCQAPIVAEFGIDSGLNVYSLNSKTAPVTLQAVCKMTGYPSPKIQWILPNINESLYPSSPKNSDGCIACGSPSRHPLVGILVDEQGLLHLDYIRPEAAIGVYTCQGNNKMGITRKSFEIKFSPSLVPSQPQATNFTQNPLLVGAPRKTKLLIKGNKKELTTLKQGDVMPLTSYKRTARQKQTTRSLSTSYSNIQDTCQGPFTSSECKQKFGHMEYHLKPVKEQDLNSNRGNSVYMQVPLSRGPVIAESHGNNGDRSNPAFMIMFIVTIISAWILRSTSL
ncbi:uncharacterized protein LOC143469160 [Clavelina lepadiformis]|uniref:uncharacterized protein LOC143469160 n=1 Tax=Clavelina lepadiformis TaxID=159417 RepID=UPI0040426F7D